MLEVIMTGTLPRLHSGKWVFGYGSIHSSIWYINAFVFAQINLLLTQFVSVCQETTKALLQVLKAPMSRIRCSFYFTERENTHRAASDGACAGDGPLAVQMSKNGCFSSFLFKGQTVWASFLQFKILKGTVLNTIAKGFFLNFFF